MDRMDELSEEEYEKVLKYMETTGEDNFETATLQLKQYNFNLDMAINHRFQPQHQPAFHPQHNEEQNEAIVRRYIELIQRRNNEWSLIGAIFDVLKTFISALMNGMISLMPEALAVRFFGTPFERIYYGQLPSRYKHQKLPYLLKKTKNFNAKSIILIVAPRKLHKDVLAFFRNEQFGRIIGKHFMLTCYVNEHEDLKDIRVGNDLPQLIVLRMNIFDEIVEVGRSRELGNLTTNQLQRWAHNGRNLFKRDGNVLVKYRNYLANYYGYHYQQEEEEEVNLLEREMQTTQIKQQNEAYKLIEQQTRKQREEEERMMRVEMEQNKKLQELQEERQIRKMSLPEEPTQGDIVRISFRCPDGSTLFRNFAAQEKLEVVYHWVQLNDNIEFEDAQRKFQLMYSFPPQPLSDKKDLPLCEIFQSPQEKIVIREL